MNFEPLTHLVHHRAILGMDLCIRKPLLVTCGVDKSVRVFNYIEKTLVLKKFFKYEPQCVALHAQGFQLLVGFADKLR